MKFWHKGLLGLIVVGALAGVYFGNQAYLKKEEEKKQQAALALNFKPENLESIQITFANETKLSLQRKTSAEPWQIYVPNSEKVIDADVGRVENLVASLGQLDINQIITTKEKSVEEKSEKEKISDEEKYGLKTEVTLGFFDGKQATLRIGQAIAFGVAQPGSAQGPRNFGTESPKAVYAMVSERSEVLVISQGSVQDIVSATFQDLRTKRIANFEATAIGSFELKDLKAPQEGELTLVTQKDGMWQVEKPFAWAGDDGFVREFLQTYQGFTVKKVYEAFDVTPGQKDKWGLTHPAAHVVFRDAKGEPVQSFDLGANKEGIFISLTDGAVGEVSLEEWNTLVPFSRSFLERLVFPFQERPKLQSIALGDQTFAFNQSDLKAPIEDFLTQAKTLEAEDILSIGASTDRLKSYGLAKPMGTFAVNISEGKTMKSVTLHLGSRVPNNEAQLYLTRSDQPSVVYIVPAHFGDTYAAALKALE